MSTKKVPESLSKVHRFRLTTILGSACALCVLSSWSFFHSFSQPAENDVSTDHMQQVTVNSSDKQSASDFLKQHAPDIDLSTDAGKKRLGLIIDRYVNEDSTVNLVRLYEFFPEQFEYKELASIALAKELLADGSSDTYRQLRQHWQGHEREPEEWFFLDAEALAKNGQLAQAIALLSSRSFKNNAEKERLIRLALLNLLDNPKIAWKHLSDAAQNDPDDPVLNIYKASLLESVNKIEPALSEYIAAIQKDPSNPFLREQLADFYLRTGQYQTATRVLEDSMAPPSLDSIWLKSIFWSRLIRPIDFRKQSGDLPSGDLELLVKYVMALPPGIFWNEEAFNALPDHSRFLSTQQETFWLQLLGELKNGNEEAATVLLLQNPFQGTSWIPQLEKSLKTALAYRKLALEDGSTRSSSPPIITSAAGGNDCKALLGTLDACSNAPMSLASNLDLPKDIHEVILSKEAFAALFLAAGCDEAALQLHTLTAIPPSFPDWISYRMAQAVRNNRSPQQALEFIRNQPPTSELALLTAELLLEANQSEAAIEKLKGVYKKNSAVGQKAAELLSKLYMEQGDVKAAKEAILSQPALANQASTKEVLARIAFQNGEVDTAYALYLSIENQSNEAKAFLVRKAFADKDWPRAKSLTEALLKQYPDNDTLKDNLLKIAMEERKEQFNMKY